ncbi:MAG: NAD(P)-dependent glycerol-3-phosphate dehydrogenase [Candidatus Wallbacteria bacterium]|nr:NAD(P)-dependent glycerol-3-phosphate dehydrogenase [Candidatus Wallbacteria bacterium]
MKCSVIGAGGFGTTMAIHLDRKGLPVKLWANFPDLAAALDSTRVNSDFLPGITIPAHIPVTSDITEALTGAELIIIAIPSAYFRQVCERIYAAGRFSSQTIFLSLTKGIEDETGKLTSQVFEEIFGKETMDFFAVLSGPNLALEIARGVPTSSVIAGASPEHLQVLQQLINTDRFRIYINDDAIGVQIGGSYKNVIAIAAGICDGLSFGLNTKASLVTRGLSEITRLGVELGAIPHTFSGLSGIGDLIATSFSPLSRNRTFGERLGRGEKVSDILSGTRMVIEGASNSRSFYRLAKTCGVDVPITDQVYQVIYESLSPAQCVSNLMGRKLKVEIY